MKEYYCVDIEFPDVDFDSFYNMGECASKIHHAHIFSESDPIQIKIFYDHRTYFGYKLGQWAFDTNFEKFGEKVKLTNENQNFRLLKIDLSKSTIVKFSHRTSFYENGQSFILIDIDSVKFYWNSNKDELYTAEFYLNNAGFKFVKDFYSPMFGWDGVFTIKSTNNQDLFYSIGKSQFRPEFNFVYSDNVDKREICIAKQPKLQFKFNSYTSEDEIIQYGNIICLLASFFYHVDIEPSFTRIHLDEYTITTKRNKNDKEYKKSCGLQAFGINIDFHQFLLEDWQVQTCANLGKLTKIIKLFNQALQVDSNSEFLIRYNILEICIGRLTNKKFKVSLTKDMQAQKYQEALNCLLQTISIDEHEEFQKKWDSLSKSLIYKPMKNALKAFLMELNLNPKDFPISLDELVVLRNNITHGSISNVNTDKVKKANALLYRLNGIVILKTIGLNR